MKDQLLNEVIAKYIEEIKSDPYHRYSSWNHCYEAFNLDQYNSSLALHLGFYLASWGMYRGSGGLLQKNHLIHENAARLVLMKEYKDIKCTYDNEVERVLIPSILEMKERLSRHYKSIKFSRGSKIVDKPVSGTDTLLSKVLLGTMACVPAYDRYFIAGLKEAGLKYSQFDEASLNELFDYYLENKVEITTAQKEIKAETGKHYPIMKIIDMYFWQVGYDLENGS